MDVDQQDVLVGTSVNSTLTRGSVSKTKESKTKESDTKESELQKEIDGLKLSAQQKLRIQELEKNQRDMQERPRAPERYSRKDSIMI